MISRNEWSSSSRRYRRNQSPSGRENRRLCDIVRRLTRERKGLGGEPVASLSVSVCDAFSQCVGRTPLSSRSLLSRVSEFFSLPVLLSLDALPGEDFAGGEQRHSAGDKSRISCYRAGALARKAAPPPPPFSFWGGNLSLADDPLKRICTRQCTTLRAATREVIQRHATHPTRHVRCLTWRDVTWRDATWCDVTRYDAGRRDAALLPIDQSPGMYSKDRAY